MQVTAIVGDAAEPRFADRSAETLLVDSHDASKRRLRLRTDAGTDVAIDLPRGAYLRDGAVLADDGRRIVIVRRKAEEAMIVRLAPGLTAAELVEHAARLAHAFGNQHVPIEVGELEIRVPVTTSRDIAARTVAALQLRGASVEFASIPLWAERPAPGALAHHHRAADAT